jgi:glucoamylase
MSEPTQAPGHPGIPPRWTSSDKSGVGTALSPLSRVWFTLSHGILNEVYYPRVDQACVRDLGLLISDGVGYFSEEKRDARHSVFRMEDDVPAFRLVSEAIDGRYRIEKQVVSDPRRDVVLQRITLDTRGQGALRLFALLAPHLVNGGAHNHAWLGDYKGEPMLFASGDDGTSLALAASVPWRARSAGFAGVSDGWQQVSREFALRETWDRADDGNVALCGELDLEAAQGAPVVLALAFGRTWSEAALRARASLMDGFDAALAGYTAAWRAWQAPLLPLDRTEPRHGHNTYRISTTVLRAHDSPSFPGGIIASLSIPWGASKGDDDLGGYHLVWPRDLAETAGALLACGAHEDARRVLDYLRAIQEPDGGWPQNTWLDGLPYWSGIQLDECAFPILLVDMARREGMLSDGELASFWPMVRAAACYLLTHGPVTGQDRWEEDAGLSPFTLAVEISALLAAAELADLHGEATASAVLRDTADAWNASVEEWTYAADTPLARQLGIDGYYVRIAPPEGVMGPVVIKNVPPGASMVRAADVVSPDALALVRFGLRDPRDKRMQDTVRAIDAVLRVDLPAGPCWHRYNGDGYGEHADGRPFDGTGIGRAWPLLTGERAHYALAAGDNAQASALLTTVEALTSMGGLMPEQVWDADDIPARELVRGEPSGSAMPLVWAHAEHVKLCRSLRDGRVFDMPPQPVQRYQLEQVEPRCAVWRRDFGARSVVRGRVLRVDLPEAGTVRWSGDGWSSFADVSTQDTGLGLFVAEIPTDGLAAGAVIAFTWRNAAGNWVGQNFEVGVTDR